MKSRIVGSLSEFAKDEPTQKSAGFEDLAMDTARLFKSKPNHNKSSSIFITMLL
jgi:hypothetical protein